MSNYTDQIDALAEREAAAIDAFAEMTDTPVELSRFDRIKAHRREGTERGLPDSKRHLYSRTASYRAHARLENAPMSFLVWGEPHASRRLPSENNRERRRETYERRMLLLSALNHMPSRKHVGLEEGAVLCGVGWRTLQRAAASGHLPVRKVHVRGRKNGCHAYTTTIQALRDTLRNKLLMGRAIGHVVAA